MGSPQDVARLVARTRDELGPIDYLAHCGAISNLADHNELTYERWRETIDVNLNGTYLAVFAVKDEMIARGFGRIVLISSIAALLPRKMQIHYAASKAGVMALTRCCAEAFAPHNVRVNCIAPGLIETEMAHVLPPERMAEVDRRHADGPHRPARGDRLGGPLPAERRIELHDRPDHRQLRRAIHGELNARPIVLHFQPSSSLVVVIA